MRINLARRFTLYIGGILLAGISAFYLMERRTHSGLIEEMGAKEARKLSTAVFEQLHTSMKLGGGNNENRAVLERFRRIPGIEEIRIINADHSVRSLDAPANAAGPGFIGTDTGGAPSDEPERLALGGTASDTIEISAEGHRTARHVMPVMVTGECTACHLGWKEGAVTGAVSVSVSLKDHELIIESHRDVFLVWGAGIFLAATLAVFALVRKRLLMPLSRLREGAEAISSGRLDFRVGLRTGDEMEQVAEAFDRMTEILLDATAELRDLGEKYSKLVSTAADTIVLRDLAAGKYTDANPAASSLLGYSKEEILEMTPDDLFQPGDMRAYLSPGYGPVGRRGPLKELLVRRKDGALVPVEVAASVLELNGRKYIQEIWRDISKRKEMEETIKRHVHELEATVRSRTFELDSSLEELKEAYAKLKNSEQKFIQSAKLISLGEMGAGIAHELNSPLAGILSITEVLMRRTGKDDPKYFLLEKVRDAAVRSKYIIMDVLTYSRPPRAEHAPMFLNEAIRATLTIFISEIKTRSIDIIEDFDPTLPKVHGNKGQVMEVVLNILKNARDAMDGKGSIFISTRTIDSDGKSYSLAEFRDTGPGVPEHIKDKVFDPFFTTKEKGGGNNIGLGLSISQSILKEHGGWIEAENHPSGGAVFRIYLPVFIEKSA